MTLAIIISEHEMREIKDFIAILPEYISKSIAKIHGNGIENPGMPKTTWVIPRASG
jgi:hypothetical protein